MKTIVLLISVLFSLAIQAACKCNCDPTNTSLCASGYDLDLPCGNRCKNSVSESAAESTSTIGFAPMITACPVSQEINPLTGAKILISHCFE